MNFRPLTFLILCIAALVAGDLSAQDQKKEASETKQVQPDKDASKIQTAEKGDPKAAVVEEKSECVLVDLQMTDICGKKVNLKKYQGKVVLVVNVASKCGFTGQYKPLQALHEKFNQHGLEVIAFPCNQFGKQEPKDENAIDAFCKQKYGIEFDLFSKVEVKGAGQVELFKRLTGCELKPAGKGPVQWNFEKFIVGKDGKPFARFRSNISPDDEKIVSKLRAALGIEDDGKKGDDKKGGDKTDSEEEKAKPAKKESTVVVPAAEKKTAPKDKQDKK